MNPLKIGRWKTEEYREEGHLRRVRIT